jgi:hypothetical protein
MHWRNDHNKEGRVRKFKLQVAILGVLILAMLVFAACGSGGSGSDDSSQPKNSVPEIDKANMNYVDRISDGVQLRFYLPEGYEYNAKYNIAQRSSENAKYNIVNTIQEFSVGPRLSSEEMMDVILLEWDQRLTSTSLREEAVTEMKESVHTIDVQGKDAIAYDWTTPIEYDLIDFWEEVYWSDEYGSYHVTWNIETDDEQEWIDSLDQFHALLQIAETGPVSSFSENVDSDSSSKTQQQSEGVNEYAKRIQPPASDGTPEGSYTVELYPELVPEDAPSERVHGDASEHFVRILEAEGETYWESRSGMHYTVPTNWPGGEPPLGIDVSICYWGDPKSGGSYVFGYWY